MTRVQIQTKIAEIESQIAEDNLMMELEPKNEYWQHDLNFRNLLLLGYQLKLEGCK